MIFLLFHIGADRYAIETARIVEVLPAVRLKGIPKAPAGISGVFDYHGTPVPVVDIKAMLLGEPAHDSLSTRLVVVSYPAAEGERWLGLQAEMATQTVRLKEEDFQEAGVVVDGVTFLGKVISDASGIIQRVDLGRLLSPAVREALWRQAEAVS